MFLQQEEKPKEKSYTLNEKRKQFPNAYKPWSTEDDKLLVTLHYENRSIEELMSIFKRNEGAINSRIHKLVGKANGEK
jgi:DNA-directed RNA polymerase specialized sigma24 family protein